MRAQKFFSNSFIYFKSYWWDAASLNHPVYRRLHFATLLNEKERKFFDKKLLKTTFKT